MHPKKDRLNLGVSRIGYRIPELVKTLVNQMGKVCTRWTFRVTQQRVQYDRK